MVKLSRPDCDNLARVQLDAVHLSNEDGGHGLIQGSSVHVDGGADRQHEAGDSFVNTQVLLQTAEGDGQCTSTVENNRTGLVIALTQTSRSVTSLSFSLTWRPSPGQ